MFCLFQSIASSRRPSTTPDIQRWPSRRRSTWTRQCSTTVTPDTLRMDLIGPSAWPSRDRPAGTDRISRVNVSEEIKEKENQRMISNNTFFGLKLVRVASPKIPLTDIMPASVTPLDVASRIIAPLDMSWWASRSAFVKPTARGHPRRHRPVFVSITKIDCNFNLAAAYYDKRGLFQKFRDYNLVIFLIFSF